MDEAAARIRGLRVGFGTVRALSGVDLDLARHRITALIGPSGAGKSTLLRSLAGALPEHATTDGEVHTTDPIRGPWVSQLPQTGALRVGAFVGDDAALEAVGLPRGTRHARMRDLTVPERQLAAVARLVAAAPPLWLLDQPTSALDAEGTARVEEILWDARGKHTVLLVTHHLPQARRASDRTCLLMAGRVVEVADTAKLFVTPKDRRTAAFVEGRLIDAG
ncbi:MAG: ATP-binding cassette domain-containing protein [Deltaproteobacteria bacterium]|nr:MAG: ATP-binding cassette domain-containing protein [Deltaproteobacteria bacterium]